MDFRFSWLMLLLIFQLPFLACLKDSDRVIADPTDEAIDPPGSITARYDTLQGVVRLDWKGSRHPDLKGFAVYRSPAGDVPKLLSLNPVLDSFFLDTVYSGSTDTGFYVFDYRVKSLGSNFEPSLFSELARIPVVPPSWVRTFLRLSRNREEASLYDTVTFGIEYNNRTRSIDSLIGTMGSEIVAVKRATETSGTDSFAIQMVRRGNFDLVVRVRDEAGLSWSDSIGISVVADPPTVVLQGDRFVHAGDSIRLQGTGRDRLGRIVKWEWKLGDSASFLPASGGDTTVVAEHLREPKACEVFMLRVTDDDGETALDSIPVKTFFPAENWAPIGNFLPSWASSAGGATQCSQLHGRLWIIRSNTPGGSAYPTHIWSSDNGKDWDLVTNTPAFTKRAEFAFASWSGKMWVIGGTMYEGRYFHDVWSSADGKDWIKTADSTNLGPNLRSGFAFAARGKLWYVKGYGSDGKGVSLFNSGDGIHWDSVGVSPIEGRSITGSAEFAGRLWFFGGGIGVSSADGKVWTSAGVELQPAAKSVVYRNRLFVMNPRFEGKNVFFTDNGTTWSSFQGGIIYGQGLCIEHFQERLWAFGGVEAGQKPAGGAFHRIFYTK